MIPSASLRFCGSEVQKGRGIERGEKKQGTGEKGARVGGREK